MAADASKGIQVWDVPPMGGDLLLSEAKVEAEEVIELYGTEEAEENEGGGVP